jgi:hypothetical protein
LLAAKFEVYHTPAGNIQQTKTITVGENFVLTHIANENKVGSFFQSLCPCTGENSDPTQAHIYK